MVNPAMTQNGLKMMNNLIIAPVLLLALSGCLDTSLTSSFNAPEALTGPETENTGPIADGLVGGPSGGDLSSIWRCQQPGNANYLEMGFGRDGTGTHLLFDADAASETTRMLWGVDPETNNVLMHPDGFATAYWFSNVTFTGNTQFAADIYYDLENIGQIPCERIGPAPPPDDPIEDILSNGGSSVSADSVWRCDTNTGIRLAFQLYDNGTGIYVDDTDPTNIGIDSWRAEAGDIIFEFEDSIIGGFRAYAVQDMDSFTSTEFLRGDASFGAASCSRTDE